MQQFSAARQKKKTKEGKTRIRFYQKRKYKRAVLSKIALKTHVLFHTKQDECKK